MTIKLQSKREKPIFFQLKILFIAIILITLP